MHFKLPYYTVILRKLMGFTDYAISQHIHNAKINFGFLYTGMSRADYFSSQVAHCQWMLDVVLSRFENEYNAVTKDNGDQICCCNTGDEMCVGNLSDLQTDCANACDTWFEVSVSPCGSDMSPQWPCSFFWDGNEVVESGSVFHFTTDVQAERVSEFTPQ